MKKYIKHWLPEICIAAVALFFFTRELGTFPAAWSDDSLFMIISRAIAEGDGYNLQILGNDWLYPYTLAIGPALTLPVALFIKLFGFSVAVARIPMVIYLIASTITLYLFTERICNRATALWSTLLLVTLSAFVNTGKPVLGEVPAFFFLMLGLHFLTYNLQPTTYNAITIGLLFGLSVMTKLTFGLIYPAIGAAWLYALFTKNKTELHKLTIIGITAVAVYVPWKYLEMSSASGLLKDFAFLAGTEDGTGGLSIVGGDHALLLRPQYLFFEVMLLLGAMGLWLKYKTMNKSVWYISATLIVLFTLYFLLGPGWYRHALLAHLLLIPFAVHAIRQVAPRYIGIGILTFFVLGQAYWQYDYRGSNRSTSGAKAAEYLVQNYSDTPLVIQQANIYVQLPRNDNWVFLTNPILTSRLPKDLITMTNEQRCMGLVRGRTVEDSDDIEVLAGKYVLIEPSKDC
ncbi:MAG: glycosyltransferase family 39 protein [bacterium]|nr:glycosyltransferase family 39 protein [bacterium]